MSFVVPARFCGPPESGNGGWVSGHLAAVLAPGPHEAVSVRLRTPPPLDLPMPVETGEDGVVLVRDAEHVVAQASRAPALSADLPAPVSFADAQAAGERYEGLDGHPFPTCFACGTDREVGDGLRLQPARVAPGDEYACAWVPAADVDVETVWAALDCPGGWVAGVAHRPMVLGTMTAQVAAVPAVGEPHVVMAWRRGAEGRKHHSGTALYAGDGRLLARAEATWIAVDPTTIRPAGGRP